MKLALAGDTMLGRSVAERLAVASPATLFSEELVAVAHEADLLVVNLECAISDRGERWPDPRKPFFFRAPPVATEALAHLGVDCVTLANNHALDYGPVALLDTVHHLRGAGIAVVGAGADEQEARTPAVLAAPYGSTVGVVGVTDHPREYAADGARPGVAYADLHRGVPGWLLDTVRGLTTDVVLVSPHWGPNFTSAPPSYVLAAARELREAGADLVAGHSAHVFHGIGDRVLYDLGGLIDDYARHPLRNDLGVLVIVTFEDGRAVRAEVVPIALDFCRTGLASGADAAWVRGRVRQASEDLGTPVREHDGRMVVEWDDRGV